MDLPPRVRKYIKDRDLLTPGEVLVLGVSGGPDSLCLLDVLHTLRDSLTPNIHVAHLDHGLRPESPAEAAFVRAEAQKRGLPFHTETADTRAHARLHKHSLEEAARELRYAFLARIAQSVGARTLAVAHTADDQAETVLMHFLRGAGVSGLRGMLDKTVISNWGLVIDTNSQFPFTLIRPLLTITRSEIEAYCIERGLTPVHDATNLDLTYFRNRLRHELLPQLETYNPNIRAVLQRTAAVMAGEHELLRAVTEKLWAELAHLAPERVAFDKARWRALALPEQRALLRQALRHLRADLRDIDFNPLDRAIAFSHAAQAGRDCDLLGDLRLSISTTQVIVSAWSATGSPLLTELPLLNGAGKLSPGWHFRAEVLNVSEWSLNKIDEGYPRARRGAGGWGIPWRVYIDAERIGSEGLSLRPRRPGDRFHPLGLDGHSLKLSDFMVNAKIEKALRDRWPLVTCGDEIVWVAGLRLDERFKVTDETKYVMRLEFVPEQAREAC